MSLLEESRKNLDAFLATSDEELERITLETSERDAVEPRAQNVHYDEQSERVVVELKNGIIFTVPVKFVQGLAGADPKLLRQVEMDGRGYGLNWEELGVTVSVPALLNGVFGSPQWIRQLRADGDLPAVSAASENGRKGGGTRTPEKPAASRASGKIGGRPRRKIAA
jgi:hypothetical protein